MSYLYSLVLHKRHIFFIPLFFFAACTFNSPLFSQEPFNPLSPENITVTPLDEPAQPIPDNEAILHEGYTLFKQENYAEAENIFSSFLAEHPEHYRTTLMLGNTLYKQNRIEEALAYYQKCILLEPGEPHGYYNIGLIYLEKDDLQTAVHFFREAERIQPNNENILYFLGDIFYKTADYPTALDYFSRVYALNNHSIRNLFRIADCFQALSKYEEEAATYLAILKIRRSAYAYHKLGLAYHSLGNSTEEINAYLTALTLTPNDNELRFNLAMAYYDNHLNEKSLAELNKITQPTEDVLYYKALIYIEVGDIYSAWRQHALLEPLNREKADEIYTLLTK